MKSHEEFKIAAVWVGLVLCCLIVWFGSTWLVIELYDRWAR